MSFAKFLFALLILLPSYAHAQSSELQGYTPPPMFGGASTPLSPPVPAPPEPVAPAPAPITPVHKPKIAIVPAKPASKVVAPPTDKEQIVHDTPLPIEPLTPRTPQKTTQVPADKEKTPAYIAPPEKKPASKFTTITKPEKPVQVQATPEVKTNMSAESLLEHPVTSDTSGPAPDIKPLAVPVGKVENALPLPGSVPAQKKVTAKKVKEKAPVKKTEVKKPEPKKAEAKKTEPKITKVIPAPIKPFPKPVPAPAIVKETPKLENIDSPLPVPTGDIAKKTEDVKPKVEDKTYTIKGRKSMPAIAPTKVEKTELSKAPLPLPTADPKLKSVPTPNEQIIDQALQEHLVEPDVKKIVEAAPVAKDTKKFVNPKPLNPPPVIMMNNKNGNTDSAPPAGSKEKIRPQLVSLEFKDQTTEIPEDMKNTLTSSILPKLNADKYARLQILAYASPTKDGQSSARRISLARGLAIRSYMLEKGIEPGRIDIRALGENSTEKPLDRADLMIISYK